MLKYFFFWVNWKICDFNNNNNNNNNENNKEEEKKYRFLLNLYNF
jgi:hypothetical protein